MLYESLWISHNLIKIWPGRLKNIMISRGRPKANFEGYLQRARARARCMTEPRDYDHRLRNGSKYFMKESAAEMNYRIPSWTWKSAQNDDPQPETLNIGQFPENRQLARPARELLLTSTT